MLVYETPFPLMVEQCTTFNTATAWSLLTGWNLGSVLSVDCHPIHLHSDYWTVECYVVHALKLELHTPTTIVHLQPCDCSSSAWFCHQCKLVAYLPAIAGKIIVIIHLLQWNRQSKEEIFWDNRNAWLWVEELVTWHVMIILCKLTFQGT